MFISTHVINNCLYCTR